MREQIYHSLKLKDTEELIEIWQTQDTDEWTELAFEVVKDLLQARLGELPPQADESQDEPDNEDENRDDEETLSEETTDQPPQRPVNCPICRSDKIFMRAVELRGQWAQVVLKKPEVNLGWLLGLDGEYDEIVGFACEDCGYVFFMLKDFV
jgi:hypothetical protein